MKDIHIDFCAFHSCDRPCSKEKKSIGDCMCHTLNWGKAEYGYDAIIKNKLIFINHE